MMNISLKHAYILTPKLSFTKELLQYCSYVASCFLFTNSIKKNPTDPNIVDKQLYYSCI